MSGSNNRGTGATAASFWQHTASAEARQATLKIDARRRWPHRVNPRLYGKFCEHLGFNIYNGMDAQILLNPTFGKWRFSVGDDDLDGGFRPEHHPDKLSEMGRGLLKWRLLPEHPTVLEDYKDGAAFGWFRVGTAAGTALPSATAGTLPSATQVALSPDVGPHGGRAQRVEVETLTPGASAGLAQWTHLPLHRTRGYEFRLVARAVHPRRVTLAIAAVVDGAAGPALATAAVDLTGEWTTHTGKLQIPADAAIQPDGVFQVAITSDQPANWVLGRVLLYPDDHINHADPEVIHLLREARLPLLRWPGGNFVSGYHWRNGVGPVDERPTHPNPAWGWLEYNLFGTHEFIAFCKAIGCEPMICINAGDGTPEEAAAWVEYCNGSTNTPMGRLRAQHGHPEPFAITHWEIGNELYGRWQITWTTPGGKVDRYLRFTRAMQAVDPSITFLGCGCSYWPQDTWDRALISQTQGTMRFITHHILAGGPVSPTTDPRELYHAFMGYPMVLRRQHEALRQAMLDSGIDQPRLGITELQMFARLRPAQEDEKGEHRLTPENMPSRVTISEALYATCIIHECIRLGDFVEMLTHSATVNHGGGLQKRRERVWGDPVHWAHHLGAALMDGTPVALQLTCGTFSTEHAFATIPPHQAVPLVDAMAVISADESSLVIMLVHRGAEVGPIELALSVPGFTLAKQAALDALAGETWSAQNTYDQPQAVVPRTSTLELSGGGRIALTLPPFSLSRLTLKLSEASR